MDVHQECRDKEEKECICALDEQLKAATEWEEQAAFMEHKALQHKREATKALECTKEQEEHVTRQHSRLLDQE